MPFAAGFDLNEAQPLLTLCANLEGFALPVPAGWTLVFDSRPIPPFDERWQLWKNTSGRYAIILRGTVVTDPRSVLEDLLSILVQATGTVIAGPFRIDYKFAADPVAAVHAGFALGALVLLKYPGAGVLSQLAASVPAGSEIYIAGHSQGAAVGTLLRSYLKYGADSPRSKNYSYKTYIFAQPKPGNDHYAWDFESSFCNSGFAFRVTNSLDWVPQVPFTIETPADLNVPNPLSTGALANVAGLDALASFGDQMRVVAANSARPRLAQRAASLARAVAPGAAPQLLVQGFDIIPISRSLNFTSAGSEIALTGTPCAGAQCQDPFFEHHATTYLRLMQAQLSS
jgi:hypothetical protein